LKGFGRIKEPRLLDTKLTAMEGKLTLLIWVVGINVAATITMLVRHWKPTAQLAGRGWV
jgi:hypothetical protein